VFLVLYVSDELGTEFAMSHDLRSTIVLLNTTFKSEKSPKQQKKTTKMHFAIDLAKTKIMKTHAQKCNFFFFFFNGNIVLGLGHLLGGHQVPPSDSVTDKCLPQSSQPPGKV
jgi:hypothetical protein